MTLRSLHARHFGAVVGGIFVDDKDGQGIVILVQQACKRSVWPLGALDDGYDDAECCWFKAHLMEIRGQTG